MSQAELQKCLICENSNVEIKNAIVSDFLSERVWGGVRGRKKNTKIIYCKNCGFAFYELRLSDRENNKLYNGYRNNEYQKQRYKFESWYTKKINAGLGENEVAYRSREVHLKKIFEKAKVDVSLIKTVLDYGGDKGQYIPTFINVKKYVYDISNIQPVEGVIGLTNINKMEFDFIMCCHVLEHASNPKEIVDILKSHLTNNGLLYLEVPFDSPFFRGRRYFIEGLMNKNFSIKSKISRAIEMMKYPYCMREHVNFFTPASVNILLNKNGFDVIEINEYDLGNSTLGTVRNIEVIAKPKKESSR
jgi:SAM-dependent methyltransferase